MIFSFFRAEVIIGFNGEHGHGNFYLHLFIEDNTKGRALTEIAFKRDCRIFRLNQDQSTQEVFCIIMVLSSKCPFLPTITICKEFKLTINFHFSVKHMQQFSI